MDGYCEAGHIRVLLIAEAASERDVRHRLAADPWEAGGRLGTVSVEAWTLMIGAAHIARETVQRELNQHDRARSQDCL